MWKRRRSKRVSIQIAVLIRAELPDGKRAQVHAFTQEINAHGGLLDAPIRLLTSQQITLVNPKTEKEIGCKVVQTERTPEASFEIAFEFDQPSPDFWALEVAPKDWGVIV